MSEVEESGDVLRDLVASDPTKYELVDRGPCGCCGGTVCVCQAFMALEAQDAFVMVLTGCFDDSPLSLTMTRIAPMLWESDPDVETTWTDYESTAWPVTVGATFQCCAVQSAPNGCFLIDSDISSPPWHLGWSMAMAAIFPPEGYPTTCLGGGGGSHQTPMTVTCVPAEGETPGYVEFTSDYNWFTDICPTSCGGSATIRIETEGAGECCSGETPLKWWCTDDGSGGRACVQDVTEAVGGPYDTQEACEEDTACMPNTYYCCSFVDGEGAVRYECVSLSEVEVGQVDEVAGEVRTVLVGPFTVDRCSCPAGCGSIVVEGAAPCGEAMTPVEEEEEELGPLAVEVPAVVEAPVAPTRKRRPCGCGKKLKPR